MSHEDTLPRGVFFQNYDLYETEGVNGPPKEGPGAGLYQNMQKYKSVADFLKEKRKRKQKMLKRRKALLQAILIATADVKKEKEKEEDKNNIEDPSEEYDNYSIPVPASDINPIGLLDNMYPGPDLEDKPVTNLYYGRLETHYAKDK